MVQIFRKNIMDIPMPMNLTVYWNFGSLLGMVLVLQILSGAFLSMHYVPSGDSAFMSVDHIMRDVGGGWVLRLLHVWGSSFFFLLLYFHMGRGVYYGSYRLTYTWILGAILFLLSMAVAFLGYVLPWGQMSFWGATVITNIFSAIPYVGGALVTWLWGGFSVGGPTLTRFYTLHVLLPMGLAALALVHMFFLHLTGSSNPLGVASKSPSLVPFHPFYTSKDISGGLVVVLIILVGSFLSPYLLSDPENFTPANPLVTPTHIMPEWYFLWLYAILRSIPNKLGGVVVMFSAIVVLFLLPFIPSSKFQGSSMYPVNQALFWWWVFSLVLLTWIGSSPVEMPYTVLGLGLTVSYFLYFMLAGLCSQLWDYFIFYSK
uniref:Cytochrome b n=1 Tax=Terebratalia transversa TaxID=34513 RepID=Q953X8_TERTR|nr:cytochrome b [Terebratalia transversa]AAK95498.1 cytochrome b [Terebratalia transversa]